MHPSAPVPEYMRCRSPALQMTNMKLVIDNQEWDEFPILDENDFNVAGEQGGLLYETEGKCHHLSTIEQGTNSLKRRPSL